MCIAGYCLDFSFNVVDSVEDFDHWEGPSKEEGGTDEYEPHCEDEDFNVSSYDPTS